MSPSTPIAPAPDAQTPDATATPTEVSEAQARARAHFGEDYYGRPRFANLLEYFPETGPVLDFGCNEGVFLNVLREHGRHGIGIDYDKKNIERCDYFGLEARHADIFEFTRNPDHHGQYAGVMMADFVEHFDPYPLQQLLQQTVDILQPGGTLVILTPNNRSILMVAGGFYESTIEHHNPYSVNGLKKFLQDQGMTTVYGGVEPGSKIPVFSLHPMRLMRNIGLGVLGRVLCGKDCLHEHSLLVMKKTGDSADIYARS